MALTMEMLADRVRAAMEAAGMSQRALGQAIGFDPPTMSKALSGKRGFKPLELALISETLGISVQQLLADDGTTTTREAVLARVQPEGNPATEQATSAGRTDCCAGRSRPMRRDASPSGQSRS